MREKYGGIGEQLEDRQRFLTQPKPMQGLIDFLMTPRKLYTMDCMHCDTPFCTVCGQGYSCGHEMKGMAIVCLHLHRIRMEQTKWGKIWFMLIGFSLMPIYATMGTMSFMYQMIATRFWHWLNWAYDKVWFYWKDENEEGNSKSCMKLIINRWCAIYCCVPFTMCIFSIVVGCCWAFCAVLPGIFVAIWLYLFSFWVYLFKLCKCKNIWITREQLLE